MAFTDRLRIICADVIEGLAQLPSESVHCVVTSPPYWGQRDYGIEEQLGLEPKLDCLGWATGQPCGMCYVCVMVRVFRNVRRVMRKDATLWLNYGDCYCSTPDFGNQIGGNQGKRVGGGSRRLTEQNEFHKCATRKQVRDRKNPAASIPEFGPNRQPQAILKPKDMGMVPARVALALQADGWWIRSEIVWTKKNPMPESVQDRPTCSHEKIFLLTRSERYYYDADAVRESLSPLTLADNRNGTGRHTQGKFGTKYEDKNAPDMPSWYRAKTFVNPTVGRNMRNVWLLSAEPCPDSHFATFPTEIPRRAILAGTSEKGCCPRCGAGWGRVIERSEEAKKRYRFVLGWRPICNCPSVMEDDLVPAVCLDPFVGSGTTAMVALELGRHVIGIDISPEYCRMAEQRCASALAQGVLSF